MKMSSIFPALNFSVFLWGKKREREKDFEKFFALKTSSLSYSHPTTCTCTTSWTCLFALFERKRERKISDLVFFSRGRKRRHASLFHKYLEHGFLVLPIAISTFSPHPRFKLPLLKSSFAASSFIFSLLFGSPSSVFQRKEIFSFFTTSYYTFFRQAGYLGRNDSFLLSFEWRNKRIARTVAFLALRSHLCRLSRMRERDKRLNPPLSTTNAHFDLTNGMK